MRDVSDAKKDRGHKIYSENWTLGRTTLEGAEREFRRGRWNCDLLWENERALPLDAWISRCQFLRGFTMTKIGSSRFQLKFRESSSVLGYVSNLLELLHTESRVQALPLPCSSTPISSRYELLDGRSRVEWREQNGQRTTHYLLSFTFAPSLSLPLNGTEGSTLVIERSFSF